MQPFPRKIRVSIAAQRLDLLEISDSERLLASFRVSTSAFGAGTEPGSHKTPLGRFTVWKKIGEAAPLGAVFVGRVATGEIAALENPGDPRDQVTTRIFFQLPTRNFD